MDPQRVLAHLFGQQRQALGKMVIHFRAGANGVRHRLQLFLHAVIFGKREGLYRVGHMVFRFRPAAKAEKSPALKGRVSRAYFKIAKERAGPSTFRKLAAPAIVPNVPSAGSYWPAGGVALAGRWKVRVMVFCAPDPLVVKLALCDWPLPPIMLAVAV